MKKTIINIMFTSNAVLVFIAVFAIVTRAGSIYARTIFEVLGANVVIHLGFFLTRKFESRYAILENLLDIGCLLSILGIFAIFFKWYSTVPIWYIFIIAVIVYLFSILLNIARTQRTAKRINELLQKRKIQNSNIVT